MKKPQDYAIRPCRTIAELASCVALQKAIWGYADYEVYPLRLFVNLGHIGGHVIGAFTATGEMVGFVASMPAWRDGARYYHSLSLGVLPEHENQGLGRALKLKQRDEALRAKISRIEWTFDPLRAKNAFFNIMRLGGVARRYSPDHYGPVESRLQQGLPSDRLVCEWWLSHPRVRRALRGLPPRPASKTPMAEVVLDFQSLAESRPEEARALQAALRGKLQRHFARGLVVTDVVREEKCARYVLDRLEDVLRSELGLSYSYKV
jgi:predicted GNAT superfamily acetyltransferase